MSYIDAYRDNEKDIIKVVERENGKRVFREYKTKYVLYYEDPNGEYRTLWGKPCKKYSTTSSKEFKRQKHLVSDKILHESDINPIFRCLEENYNDKDAPSLNVAFFDIETDFDPYKGFADPWEPFAKITAITVYQKWTKKLITFVIKPDLDETDPYFLSFDDAEAITNKFENCYLCDSESLLLELFLESIKDADILSGWNSTGYDIPYTVNRCKQILGKESMKKFNVFNTFPKTRTYIKFKKENRTYDLSGRVHLDYLELYQKHSQAEMSSYRLDYIGQVEVGEQKVQYDGTLDMLYKRDFEKFIAYNRQDVALLDKIDNKLKYIELANQIAHTNTVLIQTTMGSVALIEQAIVNESHRRGMVVPNRKNKFDDYDFDSEIDDDMLDDTFSINKGPAVGAHVADPKIGLHSEIGCCDINSLYPSAIRALNMSPETLVGQIRNDRTNDFILERIKSGMSGPEAWHNVFCLIEFDLIHNKTDDLLILDLIDGTSMEMTAKEVYDMVYSEDSNFVLSANCTIFDKSRKGIIPGLLEKWYAERKEMKSYSESYIEICEKGLEIDSELAELLMN